jgi:hypothetical protein
LKGFALPLVGALIDVEAERYLSLPSPDVAIKLADGENIKPVQPEVPISALADVVG